MAFCCCKKSKNERQDVGTDTGASSTKAKGENDHATPKEKNPESVGLLTAREENDHATSDEANPDSIVATRLTGVVDIDGKDATGVAKLSGSLYILCRNPSSILVHRDESPFGRTGEVLLGDLKDPWDLASSTKSSCLYMTDRGSKVVYKMTSESHEVTRWLENVGLPNTLTVTDPDDQVLVVRYGSPSGLVIYGSDAKEVRQIELPDDIEYPKHAVRTSAGNYVVSGKAKGSEMWGVLEVNAEGDVLRRLTQSGIESKHMMESYYLAVDSTDRLLVADFWNDRVLRFDAGLSGSQELLPKASNGMKWPWRLHYVANDSQLLVLQQNGQVRRGEKGIGEGGTEEEKTTKIAEAKENTQKDEVKEAEKESTEEKKTEKDEDEKKSAGTDKKTEKVVQAAAAAAVNENDTEKTEVGDKKGAEEEEEKKEEDRGKEETTRDADKAVVCVYSYH